jgi:hypothetical protein
VRPLCRSWYHASGRYCFGDRHCETEGGITSFRAALTELNPTPWGTPDLDRIFCPQAGSCHEPCPDAMLESALVPVEEDKDLGPRVLKLRLQGLTAAQIGRELMIVIHEVHRALDSVLPKVDAAYRRRAIAESLVTIDTVVAEHMKTIQDPESASIVIRATCERRALLGVTGSTDPVMLSLQSRPDENSNSAIDRGLKLIEKMRRLAAEKPSGGQPVVISGSAVSDSGPPDPAPRSANRPVAR